MTQERAKQIVYERFKQSLQPDKSGKGYICPVCKKSGTGNKGTGISENPRNPNHFTCWGNNCFKNADAFDIIAIQKGLKKASYEAMKETFSLYGVDICSIDSHTPPEKGFNSHSNTPTTLEDKSPCRGFKNSICERNEKMLTPYKVNDVLLKSTEMAQNSVLEGGGINYPSEGFRSSQNGSTSSYEAYIKKASGRFRGSPAECYINTRGISSEIAEHFMLGYSKSEYFPNNEKHPALIIPVGTGFYIKRNIEQGERFSNVKGGLSALFNENVLFNQQNIPVFIVESAIDALSIIQVGSHAVALNSTSNVNLLMKKLENMDNLPPFILCLDNDDAGNNATDKLISAFKEQNLRFIDGRFILNGCKDANEALLQDKNEFLKAISQAKQTVLDILSVELVEYKQQNTAGFFSEFINNIKTYSNTQVTKTGFQSIDNIFDGGLYSGLYFIGAISSLGKTTFCLQIADQIAQAGQDVLIFSLEMSRNELMAKSISRLTFLNALELNINTKNAKTTRGIIDGYRWIDYNQTEKELINKSLNEYQNNIAPHMWIFEGVGDVGVKQIKEKINKHISLTGRKPFVLIDYVQILSPFDIKATDKQNIDKAVLELKRISRDFDITILCISSFNRESYTEPINMKAFKESGAIEYGSDVLIGLQYNGMDYIDSESDKDRQKRVRMIIKSNEQLAAQGDGIDIQLKVLKNRNGKKGTSINMKFYPMFNCFTEIRNDFVQTKQFEQIQTVI